MAEQRLIDANALLDKQESLYMKDHVLFHGVTACAIENAPTIGPESLPIVQELWAELERSAVESLSHFDRSKWKPCKRCGDEDMLRMWEQWGRQYCTHCGRPLTEEAWAEMERRVCGG